MDIPQELMAIMQSAKPHKMILVGGSTRDFILGRSSSGDFDIECYGIDAERLQTLLGRFGQVIEVGKSFGVFKLFTQEREYDFSLPRKERKLGRGHRAFEVELNSSFTFEEAAARRDFTINAIGYDPTKEEWHDPFDGRTAIQKKQLKHISDAFGEDPLRVLRAMQFAGRFEFRIDSETLAVCRNLEIAELSKERLFEEFKKLFLLARKPSLGLQYANELGILEHFDELGALIGTPQDPQWHPEGDVWIHTLMVIDEAARLRDGNPKQDLQLMFSALCHDFGKPVTTVFKDGRWRSPAHDVLGMKPTELFLRKLTDEKELIENVKIFVKEHLQPAMLYQQRHVIKDSAIRRLSLRVDIPNLLRLAQADHFGRTTIDAMYRSFPAGDWLRRQFKTLSVPKKGFTPMLLGRHLIALGMAPGPAMGALIRESFQLQLEGHFPSLDSVLEWASHKLKTENGTENHCL